MQVLSENTLAGTGHFVTITYDRTKKLNALNSKGIEALSLSFDAIADDPDVRAVILKGAGLKAFVGGADIIELESLDTANAKLFISSLHSLFSRIRSLPVPVIAEINGYALGAGMELAAVCDIRIGSSTAIFGMPEVKVGLPSVIEAALLPRLVGWGRAGYLVLTGDNIDATKAYDWGFLEAVVAPENLKKESVRIAESIANAGPNAVRAQKRLMAQWEKLPVEEGIHSGIDFFSEAYESDEPQRMMEPFLKRK
ncbi:MAG: enoyl-CoA hydratase [Chloroflexota bacterium]|nr:enoyl-CoA hydratase [Chloroflexota bacterium]MED5450570.1 enoyl-CoA hydratase [Chloroflexota bacterium]MED6296305.1 enoyl-CoA hydratase [Chloroflexota bacterium]